MKRPVRLVISVVIGVALAALIAYAQTRNMAAPASVAGTRIGNNFEGMLDQNGNPVTERTFAGKYQLVFFGFTNCPSICPAELLRMKTVLTALSPAERAKTAPVFVTVDPARDTPARLKEYMAMFDPSFTALSGTEDVTKKTIRDWKIYAAKVPDEQGGYMMDHSAFLYFRGPDQRLIDLYDAHEPTQDVIAAIKAQIPD